jgi:hypothetical protein
MARKTVPLNNRGAGRGLDQLFVEVALRLRVKVREPLPAANVI